MQLHYTPEGAQTETWSFSTDKLMNAEAEAIEKVTGLTFGEWESALERSSMSALHALLWVLLKRDEPTLTYKQVQFNLSEVELVMEHEDNVTALKRLRELLAAGGIDPDKREVAVQVIATLEDEIAAVEAEQPAADPEEPEDPKVPAEPSSGSGGGLHSLPSSTSTPETSIA